MEKFIPYEKLSKKKQRELNASRRTTWTLNPVTRKPANPKAYNRKTARNWKDDSNSVPFVCAPFFALSKGGERKMDCSMEQKQPIASCIMVMAGV